jgi:hypothetical protein
MGREHLTRKRHLGNEISDEEFAIGERLRAAIENAETAAISKIAAKAPRKSAPAPAPQVGGALEEAEDAMVTGAEASQLEEAAVIDGAEILFELKKEGPITSLAIILIPEEFKQNRRIAALAATFGFVAYLPGRRHVAVAVPQGYVTDFASIPGWIQWLIAPFGRHSEAAVVHDWLYTLGTKGDRKARKLADQTFRRALAIVGVKFFRRNLMYWAVRLGGKSGFGLESDYDFRDLVRLKRREPLPKREPFAVTCKDRTLTKQEWKQFRQAQADARNRSRKRAPGESAAAPMPSEKAAKAQAQETMVAVE